MAVLWSLVCAVIESFTLQERFCCQLKRHTKICRFGATDLRAVLSVEAIKFDLLPAVYQTGPRSWRPDSSLGNHVDDDAVAGFLDDAAVRDGVRGFYAAEDAEAAAPEGDGATTVAFSLQQQQQQLAPGQSGTE